MARRLTLRFLPFLAALLVLAQAFAPLAAIAAFSETINYQGKLADSTGVAVPDGDYNIEFKLYDASSGGSLLWTETRTAGDAVPVVDGLFSVALGDVASLAGIDFDQELWLTVNIGATGTPAWDGEMTPRKALTAVPAAFVAQKALSLDATNATSTYATSTYSYVSSGLRVGTTTSAALLSVHGAALVAGTTTVGALRATGTSYFASSVGIGVVNPSALLEVHTGSFGGGLALSYNDAQFGFAGVDFKDSTSGNVKWSFGANADSYDTAAERNAFYVYQTRDKSENFVGEYRLFIADGGNVGIGNTTTPAARLAVHGSALIAGTTTVGALVSTSSIVSTGAATSTFASGLNVTDGCFAIDGTCLSAGGGSGTVNSGTTGQFAFYAADGTAVSGTSTLFVSTNSRVGVGTTTPGALFAVQGDAIVAGTTTVRSLVATSSTIFVGGTPIGSRSSTNFFAVAGAGSGAGTTNTIFIGSNAGLSASGASNSQFIGGGAGNGATSASGSTFIGNSAGAGAAFASNAVFVGNLAGVDAAGAVYSTFIGTSAGYSAENATYANFFGYTAGYDAAEATQANFFGLGAGYGATHAAQAVFMGSYAGNVAQGATSSVFVGYNAGHTAVNAYSANFIGEGAGHEAYGARLSNFIGQFAGSDAYAAYSSTFVGDQAGRDAYNAAEAVFLGSNAGYFAQNAASSTFIGVGAGSNATNASNAIFIGPYAGASDTVINGSTGSSIAIGRWAGTNGYSNSIAIGRGAVNSAERQANIGNVLYLTGIRNSDGRTSNPEAGGRLGVGTTTPGATFAVNGNALIAGTTTVQSVYATGTSYFAGNVGIGTTTPGSILSLNGVANLTTATSTFYSTGGINLADGCFAIDGTCIGGSQWTTSGSMVYYNGGNVGIGTSSPWARLSVVGTTTLTGPIHAMATSTGAVVIGNITGNARGQNAVDIQSERTAVTQVANGTYAVTIGNRNTASVSNAVAIGNANTSSGYNQTVAIGYSNTSNGENSVAVGHGNTSGAFGSMAFGGGNTIATIGASFSSAFGYGNTISGAVTNSNAFGYSNTVSAAGASAFGSSVTNAIANSVMIGPSNAAKLTILSTREAGFASSTPMAALSVHGLPGAATSYLFAVGTSTLSSTSTALVVDRFGNMGLGTTTPGATFAVNGGALVTGTTTAGALQVTNSVNAGVVLDSATGGSYSSYLRFLEGGATRWWAYSWAPTDEFYITDSGDDSGVYLTQNASSWSSYSDSRLKENVAGFSVLDRLDSYRAVTFDWKEGHNRDLGVIAQELYQSFPEIVNRGSDDPNEEVTIKSAGKWGVQYDKLGAIALQGVKEISTIFGLSGAPVDQRVLRVGADGSIVLTGESGYLNFGQEGGEEGYGFRDNGGVIEYRDEDGEWEALGRSDLEDLPEEARWLTVERLSPEDVEAIGASIREGSTMYQAADAVETFLANVSAGAEWVAQLAVRRLAALQIFVGELYASAIMVLPGGNLAVPEGAGQIAGSSVLPAGAISVTVYNEQVRLGSKIIVTPTSPVSVPLVVIEKTEGASFKVSVATPQDDDVSFDWLIIQAYSPEGVGAATTSSESAVESEDTESIIYDDGTGPSVAPVEEPAEEPAAPADAGAPTGEPAPSPEPAPAPAAEPVSEPEPSAPAAEESQPAAGGSPADTGSASPASGGEASSGDSGSAGGGSGPSSGGSSEGGSSASSGGDSGSSSSGGAGSSSSGDSSTGGGDGGSSGGGDGGSSSSGGASGGDSGASSGGSAE